MKISKDNFVIEPMVFITHTKPTMASEMSMIESHLSLDLQYNI